MIVSGKATHERQPGKASLLDLFSNCEWARSPKACFFTVPESVSKQFSSVAERVCDGNLQMECPPAGPAEGIDLSKVAAKVNSSAYVDQDW